MSKAPDYYYESLNKPQKAAYHAMLEGIKNLQPSFAVPRLEGKELADIYFMIRMDHPEIFYTTKFHYRFYQQADSIEFIPEYLFEKSKIKTHQQALKSRVEKLARPAMNLTELEKEKYVHDFICQNVRYDKLKKDYSHEIIGPLGQGVGVCEGIAKSVKILCDALGLWCIIAICGNNPEKGIKYRHTWNIVKLGKTYYHLDATFDNSLGSGPASGVESTPEPGNAPSSSNSVKNSPANAAAGTSVRKAAADDIRYDYFNIDDKAVFRDHEPVLWKVPACTDHEHFYYKENKLSFTKTEDVRKRAQQTAKKDGKSFVFHWRGGYLTREVLQELLVIIEEEAQKKEKHAHISLNWPQAVIRMSFEKEAPAEQMKVEEANEGELYKAEEC
ncbi:MAG: transglutaminase domain-containing protein [Eubacteriales bacterium]|nr:transglutaminase domain-containing protein [Eubacteriales bacterium]